MLSTKYSRYNNVVQILSMLYRFIDINWNCSSQLSWSLFKLIRLYFFSCREWAQLTRFQYSHTLKLSSPFSFFLIAFSDGVANMAMKRLWNEDASGYRRNMFAIESKEIDRLPLKHSPYRCVDSLKKKKCRKQRWIKNAQRQWVAIAWWQNGDVYMIAIAVCCLW